MTKTDATVAVIAILETLAESKEGWAPETYLYLPLQQAIPGFTLDDWAYIRGVLEETGYVHIEHNVVTLTDRGHDIVKKLAEERAKRKAQR